MAYDFTQFNPEFSAALQQMFAAAPGGGIWVNSGYRTPERQAQLFQNAVAKYGSPEAARKHVAPAGHSFHNKRLAADLGFASEAAKQWVHDNAARFGLNFPMSYEDWHIEPAGIRGGGSGQMLAKAAATGAAGGGADQALGDVVQASPMAQMMPPTSFPAIGYNLIQQAQERRQQEADDEAERRRALFSQPPASLAGLYG